jgi:hypothetical protein
VNFREQLGLEFYSPLAWDVSHPMTYAYLAH